MNLQDAIMIIILGLLAFYFIWWRDLDREEKLRTLANDLKIPFYPKGDKSLFEKLKYFSLFSISDRHKIKHMLHQGNEELIEFFESISEDELFVEGGGDQIIIYIMNERINPNELNKLMDLGIQVLTKFTTAHSNCTIMSLREEK